MAPTEAIRDENDGNRWISGTWCKNAGFACFFFMFFFVSISVDWRLLGFIHVVETMIFLCTSKYIVFIPWTIVFLVWFPFIQFWDRSHMATKTLHPSYNGMISTHISLLVNTIHMLGLKWIGLALYQGLLLGCMSCVRGHTTISYHICTVGNIELLFTMILILMCSLSFTLMIELYYHFYRYQYDYYQKT